MAKQNLLLVDADSRSLRVLEVSLRKAGYSVAICGTAEEALEMVELAPPDLIICDTLLPEMDGFAFVERLRENDEVRDTPLIFLSSDGSVESKVRGLELGVEDYLTKPIYIKEIITRVKLVLQRFERQGLERRSLTKTRFSGSLSEMGLVDLLQTIDISRKSGVLHLSNRGRRGAIYFDSGSLIHAELGSLVGERAVYRFLVWNDGDFDLEFRPVRLEERTIDTSTQGLLMEGMRRVDEWGRMLEQLPRLESVFEVDGEELLARLAEIPDEINDVLRLFDGINSLMDVVDQHPQDDLSTLSAISKLYFEGLIVDSGRLGGESDDEIVPSTDRESADGSVPEPPRGESERAGASVRIQAEPAGSSSSEPDGTKPANSTGADDGGAHASDAPLTVVGNRASAPLEAPITQDDSSSGETDRGKEEVMAKKGRRRKRAKARGENNVIQFPAQKQAVGSDVVSDEEAVASPPTGREPSGAHKVEDQAPEDAAAAKDAANTETSGSSAEVSELDEEAAAMVAAAKKAEEEAARLIAEAKRLAEEAAKKAAAAKKAEEEAAAKKKSQAAERQSKGRRGKKKRGKKRRGQVSQTPAAAEADAGSEASDEAARSAKEKSLKEGEPKKKSRGRTTSSLTIKAITETGEHAAVAEEFFTAKTYEAQLEQETWEDLDTEATPLSKGDVRAKRIAIYSLVLGLAVIGGYLIWQKVFLPQPVELAGARPPTLPEVALAATETRAEPAETEAAPAEEAEAPEATPAEEVEAPEATPAEEVEAPEATPAEEAEAPEAAPAEEAEAPEAAPAEEAEAPEAAPAAAGSYDELYAEARALRGRRQIEKLREAITVNPNGHEALADLAYAMLNRSQFAEARDLARRAVTLDPTSSKAWITLGAALQSLRDNTGAMEAYQACVDQGQGRYVSDCRAMLR